MKTVTVTAPVWVFESACYGPKELAALDPERLLNATIIHSVGASAWICIGEADVTFRLKDEHSMIEAAAEALRQKITRTQAEATAKVTNLTEKLNQLLAIEFKED